MNNLFEKPVWGIASVGTGIGLMQMCGDANVQIYDIRDRVRLRVSIRLKVRIKVRVSSRILVKVKVRVRVWEPVQEGPK